MHLYFQVRGEGPPLVVLHGLLGSLDNWQAMSKRLAQGHTVYSVDLRNHGRSPHNRVMNYRVMAQDLRELIGEHGFNAAPRRYWVTRWVAKWRCSSQQSTPMRSEI